MQALTLVEGRAAAPAPAAAPTLLEYLHACPICDNRDLRHYCRVPSLFNAGEFIRYERCTGCGTVLRNPRTPATLRLDKYERRPPRPEELELDPLNQIYYRFMSRILRRMESPQSRHRLLDFGCGAGGFLVEARAAGFDVMGLELNRGLAAHVTGTHGIRVFQGLIDDAELAAERFDVIISSEVFEHLLDPRETLRQLRARLRRPGLALIEVPNLLHVRERLRRGSTMDDAHLFYFSARSLTRLLGDAGLRVVDVHQGLRPHRILRRYARFLPLGLFATASKATALLRLRTGLSVIARLD